MWWYYQSQQKCICAKKTSLRRLSALFLDYNEMNKGWIVIILNSGQTVFQSGLEDKQVVVLFI